MKSLRVEGTLQAIKPVVDYAIRAAQEAGLGDRETFRVRLAVDELATNIVTHGYLEAGRTGDLTISAEVAADQVIIFLEDSGAGHDPRNIPPPPFDSPPAERPLGGLGVYLALWAVDEFHYERCEDNNKIVLVVERSCALPP